MSRNLPDLADTKGNKLVLYAGTKTNDDRTFTFKLRGLAFDITAFDAVKFVVKEPGGAIADAHIPEFDCPVLVAADGTVTVPFSTLTITKTGEGLVAIIYEKTAANELRPKKMWNVDIKHPEVQDLP